MIDLSKIVEQCKSQDRKAQKELYDVYSPVLLGICIRYSKSKTDAEDILQEGFIKIFTKINNFKGNGSFEGWMRRIIVNTAISHYHKNKKHNDIYDITEIKETDVEGYQYNSEEYTKDELLSVINSLPEGYKMVFNLYAIEGYKHKEEKIRDTLSKISKIKIENEKS